MKNILHISDIHVSSTPAQGMNEYALKNLLLSLNEDLKNLPTVDTIFITGDIAYSGRESEYQIFLEYFIDPLLIELKLDYSRVFIVPGNHDSNRQMWKKSDQFLRAGLVSDPIHSAIDAIIQEKIEDHNCQWSSAFSNMRDSLDSSDKKLIIFNKFFAAYEIDGIGIGCINSAWLSNENDKEAIFVSEWQFKEIIGALKPFDQKIILMHHPFNWLHPEDMKSLMNNIHSSKIDCLFGIVKYI